MRAVLSLGSNMEDSRAHLASVVEEFAGEIEAASSVHTTAPWGGVEQDDFLNQVLVVTLDPAKSSTPQELLRRCQHLEEAAHRTREVRWGPRTLDVDIVQLIDDTDTEITSDDPELTLPHPRAHQRAFVLVPWLEADPDARLGGQPVAKLVEELDQE